MLLYNKWREKKSRDVNGDRKCCSIWRASASRYAPSLSPKTLCLAELAQKFTIRTKLKLSVSNLNFVFSFNFSKNPRSNQRCADGPPTHNHLADQISVISLCIQSGDGAKRWIIRQLQIDCDGNDDDDHNTISMYSSVEKA